MRLSEIFEYFTLRKYLEHAWSFLATRKRSHQAGTEDIRFRGGFSVRVRNVPMDRHILHRIFARDEYRLDALSGLDTVVDVGAHIGLFAVRAAPLARRILCFEPSPDNREMLQHNLSDSRFSHVEVDSRAISGRAGSVTLHLSSNPSAHSFYGGGEGAGISVDAVTLESVFQEYHVERCDLLKLDCEGAEYDILKAVPEELWSRILRIHMECHPVPDDPEEWDAAKLGRFLNEKGYACTVLPSKRREDKGHLFAVRGEGV